MNAPTIPVTILNPEGKPYRLSPLKQQTDVAGEITVVCFKTKARAIWNKAAESGWCADLNGKAFVAYYSPEGIAQILSEQRNRE